MGYLFLQKIYYELGLDRICRNISRRYNFEYDLNSILSRLVYARVLSPGSKLSTMEYSTHLPEKPKFELHQIYRALEVISKETDYIQAELYKASCATSGRNDKILYYDVTIYCFEIEEADEEGGLRQYGVSKENRSNPIVQMGLLLDASGIPLAFCINPGNTNKNSTLRPLDKQIISDFEHSEFVVCTDAGLSSADNRGFNSITNRRFITVQSIKMMKKNLKEWALSNEGWSCPAYPDKAFSISEIKSAPDKYRDDTFYKEQWFRDKCLSQRFIVTFSIKYMEYLRALRDDHIKRVDRAIQNDSVEKHRQTDPKGLISKMSCTDDGEIAENNKYSINNKITEEEMYDGFYAIATNLKDTVSEIIKVNKQRLEIEESFSIMKSEFNARPVYLSRDDRIKAHFTTCFIALVLFRYLEKTKLKDTYTYEQLIYTLRSMRICKLNNAGYIPTYTRTDTTDRLHEFSGFRTDYEIIPQGNLKQIISDSKKS